ncbi:MAG: hypothetical protein LBE99_00920 [Puniceicoccales bacterium]|jgi:hypothetical protein|nr:hypothetical protein [Puniceicoccales bacterium]
MKIKHYYYIILGVFCLCLENQTLFGTKIQIPKEVMRILQDQNYKDQHDQIMEQQTAIREGYKASICKTYNIEGLSENELLEWIEDDLREGVKIGPEYYALARIRQYHEQYSGEDLQWQEKSKNDFFYADSGKSCHDNGVRFEDFESPAGETNIYWALYQAGLIFMQTEPEFAMFCFKHLLILSNGQIPAFLFGPDYHPESNAVRRLQAGLGILGGHYFYQGYINNDRALKIQAHALKEAVYEIVKY